MKVLEREDIKKLTTSHRVDSMESLFEQLADVLNDVHGTSYSLRFRKILLESHLKAMISRRAVLSSREIKRKPDLFAINSSRIPNRKLIFKQRLIDFAKYLKKRTNLKKVYHHLRSKYKLRIGFFEYPGLDEEGIGVSLPTYHSFSFTPGDMHKREEIYNLTNSRDEQFIANTIRQLPKVLVEHFANLTETVEIYSPSLKELHVHTTQSFFNQVLIALYVEKGAKLLWYQHGSFYGEFAGDGEHKYEHDISDQFRTWGWKIREKDTPWKAYRLEKFRQEYEQFSNTKECDLLISYSKIDDGSRIANEELTDYLLNNLDPEKYKKILARPQPTNKVFSQKSQLDFIDSERIIKSKGLLQWQKICPDAGWYYRCGYHPLIFWNTCIPIILPLEFCRMMIIPI